LKDIHKKGGSTFMGNILYRIEKGEKWLTQFEKRQWHEKVKALVAWFQEKGMEITPWIEVRLRELLILTCIIQRIEEETMFSKMYDTTKQDAIHIETNEKTKTTKPALPIQNFEVLCKYMERLRKLVQEFEDMKTGEQKPKAYLGVAELVQDLMRCAREIDNRNGKGNESHLQCHEEIEVGANMEN